MAMIGLLDRGLAWLGDNSREEAAGLWTRDGGGGGIVAGAGAAISRASTLSFVTTSNSTSAAINATKFASAQWMRIATFVLVCINIVAALVTVIGILWASDPFPLILSTAIVVQGIIFAAAQSTGLQALLVLGCTLTSQLMFPAAFIVPYLQLAFGLELAFRALRPGPFRSRHRWTVAFCVGLVGALLLIHLFAALVLRPSDFCFPSLFWFLQRYAIACFGLFLAIPVILVFANIAVGLRLKRDTNIDPAERAAASGMVCHMTVAMVTDVLVVPFFFVLAFRNQREAGPQLLRLSLLSAVAANISGLVTGCLCLFLRSSPAISVIRPGGGDGRQPGSSDGNGQGVPWLRRTESAASLISNEKEQETRIETPPIIPTLERTASNHANVFPFGLDRRDTNLPPLSTSGSQDNIMVELVAEGDLRTPRSTYQPSYGRPTQSMQSAMLLPSTAYAPSLSSSLSSASSAVAEAAEAAAAGFRESGQSGRRPPAQGSPHGYLLAPPPSLVDPERGRHRRDSSMSSSATVQIWLRLSAVEDVTPLDPRYFQDDGARYSVSSTRERTLAAGPGRRPSPLSSSSLRLSSMVIVDPTVVPSPTSLYSSAGPMWGGEQQQQQLTSKVYSPRSPSLTKLPSL